MAKSGRQAVDIKWTKLDGDEKSHMGTGMI